MKMFTTFQASFCNVFISTWAAFLLFNFSLMFQDNDEAKQVQLILNTT